MNKTNDSTLKSRVIGFVWQHVLLVASMYLLTLGVALCVRSGLGSGVISSIPMVMSLAGIADLAPKLTIGQYTYIMNGIFVGLQICLLRRSFQPVQLFQLLIGFVFGWLLDINMVVTDVLSYDTIPMQIVSQFLGCTIIGVAVSLEIRCGSVTMPGEGIQMAICRITNQPFPKIKIIVDTVLVIIASAIGFVYFDRWMWNVVGIGTLFAMFYVGLAVKFTNSHTAWFDRLLHYTPGFRRYIYGLARYIYPHKEW